ncbi:alpha/beta hydrolase [Streptomyces sp. GESEQ-35]|uniref:alpha/beta fold hydrolase n=1 Tax=Streptomyces sp. GESEQ-35 TaxID=2812657 RepID=UPI001B333773
MHQVLALVGAGYRVATFDARGISPMPRQADSGFLRMTINDLVDDVAKLTAHLGGPAHVVGTSLGARVVTGAGAESPGTRAARSGDGSARAPRLGERAPDRRRATTVRYVRGVAG